MEITLNEKDMQDLVDALAKRIEDRVIGKLMGAPSYEALTDTARRWATVQIKSEGFQAEAIHAMKEELSANGQRLLRKMVLEAVRSTRPEDPELRKIIAEVMYEEALAHAEKLLRPTED